MEESKRKDSVAEAVTTPFVTQSADETARVNAQSVSQDEQMLTALQHTEVTMHKTYTSKAEFEADRALFGHKHGLAKARESTEDQHSGHDSPREVQTGSALDTVLAALDALGADAGAGSDLEDDDEAGDGSETQAGTNVSAWHTSTTYRGHRDDNLTPEQITKADALAKSCPLELWRVSAATGSNHTSGWTSQQHIKPPAAVEGLKSGAPIYKELSDFPSLSAVSRNLAGRLLCTQSNVDQFTSYTVSLPFALVLARRREALGQGGISITRVVTRKITTLNDKQAKFHFVPELLDILGVAEWEGLSERARRMLTGARFHHEYVALGELDLTRNPYRPVQFDELKSNGLYNFRPGIHIGGNEVEEKKLYYRRLQLSHQWYGPETTAHSDTPHFSNEFLDHAARLARLFDPTSQGLRGDTHLDVDIKASFSIFLDLLSLFRWRKDDQLFVQYIRDNYSTQEVQGILYRGIERVPNNSPDRLQVMERIREACIAVRIPEPPATDVMLVDALFDFDGAWHGDLRKITGAIAPRKKLAKTSITGVSATALEALGDSTVARSRYAGSASLPASNKDLLTRLSLWYDYAVPGIGNGQNDMYDSSRLFDDELRDLLNDCKRHMAEGTRRTCWISGFDISLTDAWLMGAVKLVEAHSAMAAKDAARMATICEEVEELQAGLPVDKVSAPSLPGCARAEGCGTMWCSTCMMKPSNKDARRSCEREQGTKWKFKG
ncbi:hypothetical protein LTR27_001737 [Elasticomyces elasticus]|nr:hypothetical protein LTR27_001737 [Elasticomyces elasticus]